MVLKNDDFNDNVLDTTFWDKVEVATGVFTEQNQRAECNCPANADVAGLVTKNSHDLQTCDIKIDVNTVNLGYQVLMICLTKTTIANPYGEADWYRIMRSQAKTTVQKRKGGAAPTSLYDAARTGASGSLRIVIGGGTISFYEEANLRYSESYDFGSYVCYVYIVGIAEVVAVGMDYFDNFLGSSGVEEDHTIYEHYYDDTDYR